MHNDLTDVAGLKVGHWTDKEGGTGCTVILCDGKRKSAVAGVDVRGGAPGSRELALLDPLCRVDEVHAILLGGGSAFGLAAADGVMWWLEERHIGFDVGVTKVPIVPAAILFDLPIGKVGARPDSQAGYAACEDANDGPIRQGNVGAGTGATVGKALGFGQATKSGLGSASTNVAGGIVVAALTAVNAFGHVFDPQTQQIIAGPRKPVTGGFVDTVKFAKSRIGQTATRFATGGNTTLAVVATNVKLNKTEATKVAQMAHDGLARTIRPIHTNFDGDTIFALSHGDQKADVSLIGTLAADVLVEAVLAATHAAVSAYGLPAARDL